MGFFEIGIYHTKTEINVGTLWRSAYQLGAAGLFTIGRRYKQQPSDTTKTMRQLPIRHYVDYDDFSKHRPMGAILIGVEMGGTPLGHFWHPKQAIYLLGAEDHGLPDEIAARCNTIVSIESIRSQSYNVAVAGSLVMYQRFLQQQSGLSDFLKGTSPR